MMSAVAPAGVRFRDLTLPERVVGGICLLYPFRILIWTGVGVDLHFGLVSATILTVLVVSTVRSLPRDFPRPLDLAVLVFVSVAIVDLTLLQPVSARAIKGFGVETRFAFFYLCARLIGLRREFADWLFAATLVLVLAAALVGVVEHHLEWGWLLEQLGAAPDRRFRKMGIPRLYSFAMTPASAAYLFLLGVAACVYFSERRARPAFVASSLVAVWQALPLTLTRTAVVLVAATTVVASVRAAVRRSFRFAAFSAVAMTIGAGVFWLRGWDRTLVSYAAAGAALRDGSARSHISGAGLGVDLVMAEPLGYGFGQGGHLALWSGGVYPVDDTHYLTLAVQMGTPGLVAFLLVVALAGAEWLALARNGETAYRALGSAGFAIWLSLLAGGLFLPTWNMLVPQLWFWLLSAVAVNESARRGT